MKLNIDTWVEYCSTVAALTTITIVLTLGLLFFTWVAWHTLIFSMNKYGRMKEKVWVVRRWSESEAEIKRLEAENKKLSDELIIRRFQC